MAGVDATVRLSSSYSIRPASSSLGRVLWTRRAATWPLNSAALRPDGTVPARIRYHLVNGLLYALFTSPVGTRLFGIRNPIGYPGGYYGSDRGESG